MKDDELSRMSLEAVKSDINPNLVNLKDSLGSKIGKVWLPGTTKGGKNGNLEIDGDNLEKVARAAKKSEKTVTDMVKKSAKFVAKYPEKFGKNDDTPDFQLSPKAGNAAEIIATPDGTNKHIKTGVEVGFADLTERLLKLIK